jgi:hypothetical protein
MLMRRYNQRLFRVIRSVVTNDGEAEDVLQEESSPEAVAVAGRFDSAAGG